MVSPVLIRPALVILVTTAIIFIVIAVSRNGSNHPAPVQSAFQQLPQNIDIALKQARFSEIRDGSVVWELLAEKVEYDKSGETAHLSGGITIDFLRSGNRGAVKVTADSGEYRTDNNNMKLRGKVHLLTEEGAAFDTDSIDYTSAVSQFKTSDRIAFRQERLMLNAVGMEMDVRNQHARFLASVDSTVSGFSSRRGGAPVSKVNSGARKTKKHVSKRVK